MADQPLISICIPAYQRPDKLKHLLDSIETQSYRHFEVIITDDSSGSEVYEMIQQHSLGSAIRYFRNSRPLGTPENWNESIRKAAGAWIKLMHDDDWFNTSDALERFALALQSGRTSFYFSAYTNVYPDGSSRVIRSSAAYAQRLTRLPELLLASNRIGPPSAVIFKNDPGLVFDNRMRWLVDLDFYIRYLKKYPQVVYLPETLISIGISDSQVTKTSFGNRAVEIPERFMVLAKTDPAAIKNLWVYDSWWRFIRNLKIRSAEEISASGVQGRVPGFVVSIIEFQQKIPASLLNIPPLSKLLMMLSYLKSGTYKN